MKAPWFLLGAAIVAVNAGGMFMAHSRKEYYWAGAHVMAIIVGAHLMWANQTIGV